MSESALLSDADVFGASPPAATGWREIAATPNRGVTMEVEAPQPVPEAPPPPPQASPGLLSDADVFGSQAPGGNAPPPPPQQQPGVMPAITGFMANLNRGLGVGDEAAAGFNTIRDIVTGNSGPNLIQTFKDELAGQRKTEDAFTGAHPTLSALAKGTGMAGLAAVNAPAAAEAVPALAAGRVGAIAQGATSGGLQAGGYALADRGTPAERLRAADAAIPVGMGLGGGLGIFAPTAPRLAPEVASLADHLTTGVDPIPAVVGTNGMQRTAQIVKGIPVVGAPLVAAADRTAGQLDSGLQRIATSLGPSTDPLGAGSALQRGATDAVDAYKVKTNALYAPVNAMEADPRVVPLRRTQGVISDMFSQYPNVPDWLAKSAPNLVRVKTALDGAPKTVEGWDAVGSGAPGIPSLTFGELKAMRSDIGKMVDDHLTVGNIDQARLKTLYGAMSDDMMSGAGELGGADAQAALSRADTYNAAKSARISNVLDKVIQASSPEQAYSKVAAMAGSTSRADANQLGQLRRSLDPDAWNEFSGGVIHQMGRDGSGNFSPDKFVTAWSKLTPQGKQTLFGDATPDLEAFARVAGQQKAAGKFYNHSGSGSHLISAMLVLDPLMEGSKALMEGNSGEAIRSVVAPAVTGVAGNVAARLLAYPGWGRAMLRAAQTPSAAPQIISDFAAQNPAAASMARLYGKQQGIATAFPGLAASVPSQQSR